MRKLAQYGSVEEAGVMADDHAHSAGEPDADFAEHVRTYQMFLQLVKYTVIGVAALLALMAFFLG